MLSLSLLGKPHIQHNGQPLTKKPPKKAQAVFFYLAANNAAFTRTHLATLLWSAKNFPAGGLNGAMHKTKQTPIYPYLRSQGDYLSLDKELVAVDVHHFEQVALIPNHFTLAELIEVGQLYRGAFLDGFTLPTADSSTEVFEEWRVAMSSRLERLALALFGNIINRCQQRGLYADALPWVEKQLALDDSREDFHRTKMMLLHALGKYEEALTHCHHLCAVFDVELDALQPATVDLYYQLLAEKELVLQQWVAPFQAPRLPEHFSGRNQPLSTLTAQLTESDAPCHAIVGMGGIGKTTLATAIAHQLREHFMDGVLWAFSADAQDLASILQHWGRNYGREWTATDINTLAPLFRDLIADKHVLIVLDDATQAEAIRPILPNTPTCALLLTTRDHTLAHALNANLLELEVLSQENSLGLMRKIVGESRVSAESDACHTICNQLEHLPLAIEIIAQRINAHRRAPIATFAENLATIQTRLDQLNFQDRAIRASFELSWHHLNPSQQHTFSTLAVFAGRTFAAPAIAHITDTPASQTTLTLDSLINLSLLTPIDTSHYRQHALLADFAHEKAHDNGLASAQTRMVSYYTQFAHDHQTDYDALRPEWVNLHAAITTAHDQQQWQAVLDLTQTLTPSWFTRARYTDARQTYPLAISAARNSENSHALAITALNWGKSCIEQDDFQIAKSKLETAFHLLEGSTDHASIAETMLELGRISIEESQYEEAHQHLSDAHQLAIQNNNVQLAATALYRIARLHRRNWNLEQAEAHCHQILTLPHNKNLRIAVKTLRLLALIHLYRDDFHGAREYCESALASAEILNDKDETASVLYAALSIASKQKNSNDAEKYGELCLHMFKQMGARKLEALTLYELGRSYLHEKKYRQTLKSVDSGIEILRRLGDIYNLVFLLTFKGIALVEFGEVEKACAEWHTALEHAIRIKHQITHRIQQLIQQYCENQG